MPDPGADRGHVIRLREAGIETVAALGASGADTIPKGISAASMSKLREQAAMQLRSRENGVVAWALRTPNANDPRRGLALLPPHRRSMSSTMSRDFHMHRTSSSTCRVR